MDFFLPHLNPGTYLNFSGGEPLLALETIRETVAHVHSEILFQLADIHYSITTNGSLVTPDVVEFLDRHHFLVLLSFDGTAQEATRKKGSFNSTVSLIESLLRRPNIRLLITSVFTSETIGRLTESIRFMTGLGIQEINLTFANLPPWDDDALEELTTQLSQVKDFLLPIAREGGTIALRNYRKPSGSGPFRCAGGSERMALAADGTLWGCHLFSDYCRQQSSAQAYSTYCFGHVDDFVRKHEDIYPKVAASYSTLTQHHLSTPILPCRCCPEMEKCQVCPVNAAFVTSEIGMIPQWTCEIKKIMRASRKEFWDQMKT